MLTTREAWILGAVLPLPTRPHAVDAAPPGVDGVDRVFLQNTSVVNVIEMDERRYQKARWWRILNRIMVAPAILIMGAVVRTKCRSSLRKAHPLTPLQVALAVVATHPH